MRNTILTALGAIALASCGAAPAPDAEPVAIEAVALKPCPSSDPNRECEFDATKAPEYLRDALAGDYQAQRNVSYMHTASRPWNVQQPVQGCAWRMVIMVTRPASSTMDDAGMYRIQCGSLSDGDQTAAREVAQLIHRQVKGSDLPTLPPIPA